MVQIPLGFSLQVLHSKQAEYFIFCNVVVVGFSFLGQKHQYHSLVFSEANLDCLSGAGLVLCLLGELVFPKHFCIP